MVMNQSLRFEDGLLVCLDIVYKSTSLDEAKDKILHLLEAYKGVEHEVRLESIKEQLGLWRIS